MTSLPPRDQLQRARRFHDRPGDLAERDLDAQLERITHRLRPLVAQAAPALVGLRGAGPHVGAQLLAAAGDNAGRLTSEAPFANLCGAYPIPASSGHTQRHRLNRGGDRRAHRVLHTIVFVRMRHDPRTRAYAARKTAEGKTRREIIRYLKRFVAREVFHARTHPPAHLPTGTKLRQLRTARRHSLTAVCNTIAAAPTRLSELERGNICDTDLARRAHTWLTTTSTRRP